jgi:DNA-binding response OmpR family regulator
MKILLLEDEEALNANIVKFFTLKGHSVDSYFDGGLLLKNANLFEYDFFLFDISVPDINGFELLEYIRDKKIKTPLILMTALIGIEDVAKGFELGCSDYLKKPFDLQELQLRIDNINKIHKIHKKISLSNEYSYDLETKTLMDNDNNKKINLSKKQADILYLLIKHHGYVVSYDTIADYIYKDEFRDMHTISSHIRDIRKMIGVNFIENIRGIGYKIVLD